MEKNLLETLDYPDMQRIDCSRILMGQKLNDLMTENLSVIKPIYFTYFCDPSLFYLSTSQNLVALMSTQI